jgi:hypothetical protein
MTIACKVGVHGPAGRVTTSPSMTTQESVASLTWGSVTRVACSRYEFGPSPHICGSALSGWAAFTYFTAVEGWMPKRWMR